MHQVSMSLAVVWNPHQSRLNRLYRSPINNPYTITIASISRIHLPIFSTKNSQSIRLFLIQVNGTPCDPW